MANSDQTQAIDPVCGMTIDRETAAGSSVHQGATYYFCCGGCKKKFDSDPARFTRREITTEHAPRG